MDDLFPRNDDYWTRYFALMRKAQMATEQADDDDQQQPGGFDDETMRMLSANLPDKIFRAPDPRIQMAAMEAERTQQMTPVLKEELRLRILTKRMERGEPDIETTHTPQTYELTEEEKLKRERRKEQNRRAAKKCREKRKMRNLDVAERYDLLQEENDKLSREISCRRKQREQLVDYIKEHIKSGQCKLSASQTKLTDKQSLECSTKLSRSNTTKSRTSCSTTSFSSSDPPSTRILLNLPSPALNPPSTLSSPTPSLNLPSSSPTPSLNLPSSSSTPSMNLHSSSPSPSKLPKLSLTIPGYPHTIAAGNFPSRSPVVDTITDNNITSCSNNKIYQILVSPPPKQHSPVSTNAVNRLADNFRIVQTPQQNPSRQQHQLNLSSTFQITVASSSSSPTPTSSSLTVSPIINQLTTTNNISQIGGFSNQQQYQPQQQQYYNSSCYNNNTNMNIPSSFVVGTSSSISSSTVNHHLPTNASPNPAGQQQQQQQPLRPSMSRTPSTTTSPFAPPQSPCTGHQSSSITLTPPPSVSSEQYFVPESPSILNSFTTTTTTTTVGIPNDLVVHCGIQSAVDQNILTPPIIYPQLSTGIGLNYQLSPADSLSGKSPPGFDILTDKMFDDEDDDDEDDDDRNNLTHILDTLD